MSSGRELRLSPEPGALWSLPLASPGSSSRSEDDHQALPLPSGASASCSASRPRSPPPWSLSVTSWASRALSGQQPLRGSRFPAQHGLDVGGPSRGSGHRPSMGRAPCSAQSSRLCPGNGARFGSLVAPGLVAGLSPVLQALQVVQRGTGPLLCPHPALWAVGLEGVGTALAQGLLCTAVPAGRPGAPNSLPRPRAELDWER